jgi:hypothetical protein
MLAFQASDFNQRPVMLCLQRKLEVCFARQISNFRLIQKFIFSLNKKINVYFVLFNQKLIQIFIFKDSLK